jgi:hypothetical protein
MESIRHLLHWFVEQWNKWGVTAIVAGAASAVTWTIAQHKEWKESRRIKREKKNDTRVRQAMENPNLWPQLRPLTGAGVPLIRAAELANHLNLNLEVVGDSLERLEGKGRVVRTQGTLDNPANYWHVMFR